LEDPGVDEKNIKMHLPEWNGVGVESTDLVQDTDRMGSCKCGNEPVDSIKCGEFE
jgi:hypothetical protein